MQLGVALPLDDIGGDPSTLREFAQAAEAEGYDELMLADHVLGVNAASRPGWDMRRATSANLYHDPFVLFGFLAACTTRIGFSTQVLILPQRQTVLVAKQAASLDVLCRGRFRLGGWRRLLREQRHGSHGQHQQCRERESHGQTFISGGEPSRGVSSVSDWTKVRPRYVLDQTT